MCSTLLITRCVLCGLLLLAINPTGNLASYYGSSPTNYRSLETSSKWSNNQQQMMERILTAIDLKLEDLSNRQKIERYSNSMATNTINDLQIINHRLQNIEDQIARAESFNRLRLDKIFESLQKEEFVVDQLIHKIDKNQQQINNRLLDVETVLEKVSKGQEDLTKNIEKVNTMQTELAGQVEEISENMQEVKIMATESFQNLNISQQTFHQHLMNMITNVSNHAEITDTVKKLGEQLNNTTANGILKCAQSQDDGQYGVTPKGQALDEIQKDLHGESLKLIAAIDNMYNDLRQQSQSVESLAKENLGVSSKIYKKINEEQDYPGDLCENMVEAVRQEIANTIRKNMNQLEVKFKQNFEMILVEQHGFMDNCHRLQLNEDQIESRLITVVEQLTQVLDNRTNAFVLQIEDMSKQMQLHEGNYNTQIEDLYKFFRNQGSHVTRTIAHATNKVMEMDRNSKQLQSTISSLKDSYYNMSQEIQDINNNMGIFINLMTKEIPKSNKEQLYANDYISPITIIARKWSSNFTDINSTDKLNKNNTDFDPTISATKDVKKYSPELTDEENVHKSDLERTNISKEKKDELKKKSKNEPRYSTILLDYVSKENATDNLSDDNSTVNLYKKRIALENVSEILLKYFKASKPKIPSSKPENPLIFNNRTSVNNINTTENNQVLKYTNELLENSKPDPFYNSETKTVTGFPTEYRDSSSDDSVEDDIDQII